MAVVTGGSDFFLSTDCMAETTPIMECNFLEFLIAARRNQPILEQWASGRMGGRNSEKCVLKNPLSATKPQKGGREEFSRLLPCSHGVNWAPQMSVGHLLFAGPPRRIFVRLPRRIIGPPRWCRKGKVE